MLRVGEHRGFSSEKARVRVEAERAYESVSAAIENGSAKRYSSLIDVIAEIDDELRIEEKTHA